jgi:hypothetical protein
VSKFVFKPVLNSLIQSITTGRCSVLNHWPHGRWKQNNRSVITFLHSYSDLFYLLIVAAGGCCYNDHIQWHTHTHAHTHTRTHTHTVHSEAGNSPSQSILPDNTPHSQQTSLGLLWTCDQPAAETSPDYTTLTNDIHSAPLDKGSARRGPPPDNTQHSQQTDINRTPFDKRSASRRLLPDNTADRHTCCPPPPLNKTINSDI